MLVIMKQNPKSSSVVYCFLIIIADLLITSLSSIQSFWPNTSCGSWQRGGQREESIYQMIAIDAKTHFSFTTTGRSILWPLWITDTVPTPLWWCGWSLVFCTWKGEFDEFYQYCDLFDSVYEELIVRDSIYVFQDAQVLKGGKVLQSRK